MFFVKTFIFKDFTKKYIFTIIFCIISLFCVKIIFAYYAFWTVRRNRKESMISNINPFMVETTEKNYLAEELPYEKFKRFGAESLSASELLAIIIRTGTGKSSALDIAREVLTMGGGFEQGLNSLYHLSLEDLMKIDGIGEVKAVKIKCIAELARRMWVEKKRCEVSFNNPDSVADYYIEQLRHEEREYVIMVSLNNALVPINETVISIGTVNSSLISTREVFRNAVKSGAVKILLLHNHPGGNPTPSNCDIAVTKKIKEAGNLMDIQLLDHIVIGDNDYYSFKKEGLL